MRTTSAPASIANVSRRTFLRGMALGAGALVLGVRLAPRAGADDGDGDGDAPAGDADAFSPNVWLVVAPSGAVTIVAHRSEMGTGIRTSLPMVVADELEADWDRVTIEQAVGDAKYGSQNTDGSRSVRDFFDVMRRAGATARHMLEAAAAAEWGVDAAECRARAHAVHHEASGRSLGFGALAPKAREQATPEPDALRLKPKREWRYIGKDVPITDLDAIVTGRATFGMDAALPGMKIAVVARCPVAGGAVRSFDASAAEEVAGVEHVVELPAAGTPAAFHALGGVAVVARDTWAALEGRRALRIEWDEGPNASYDSRAYAEALRATVRKPGEVVREAGDVDAAFEAADRTHTAEYYVPHLAHASMEPPAALARFADGRCTCWAPTQNPQAARTEVAGALGLDEADVTVHVTLLGGGFGRKSKPDFVAEAALLSREVGAPVKVVWTREDDVRHDYYHTVTAMRLEAALDGEGRPTGWRQRTAFPSIMTTFDPAQERGSAMELGLGFTDLPFAVPALRCEVGEAKNHVRIGWLRSVSNIPHAFGICSFADELAHAAGRDPLDYLRELIGEPRRIDLSGVEYGNYGKSLEEYPLDTGRLRSVLDLAAERAGWGRDLPRGRGLGIAVHRSFLSYVANVVEVEVARDGTVSIPRVDVVIDAGLVVHPERVHAQLEGSAVFGASVALTGEVTAEAGRIVQSNFHDYPVARIYDAPREVRPHVVASDAPPAGVGEPAVPPFPPALCNAVFAATGRRIRDLPLSRHDLSWS